MHMKKLEVISVFLADPRNMTAGDQFGVNTALSL